MNDILGTFKSEFMRPLATLIMPGLVALTPYLVAMWFLFPRLGQFAAANQGLAILVVFIAAMFLGLIFENAGSAVEASWDDDDCVRVWDEYLRLAFVAEPVGQKYIRSVLLRMKFELGTMVALLAALPGVALCYLGRTGTIAFELRWKPLILYIVAAAIAIALAWRLLKWAEEGHSILHETRIQLLKGVTVISAKQ